MKLRDVRLAGVDLLDPRRAQARKISVILHHPPGLGRIALAQQKTQLIRAADRVLRAHLRGQRGALGLEGRAIARRLGVELVALSLDGRARSGERLEPAALCRDGEIRSAQARAQGIALLELGAKPAGELSDALRTAASLAFACAASGASAGAPSVTLGLASTSALAINPTLYGPKRATSRTGIWCRSPRSASCPTFSW